MSRHSAKTVATGIDGAEGTLPPHNPARNASLPKLSRTDLPSRPPVETEHATVACGRPNSVFIHYSNGSQEQRLYREDAPTNLLDIDLGGDSSPKLGAALRKGQTLHDVSGRVMDLDAVELLSPRDLHHMAVREAVARDRRSTPEKRQAYKGIPGMRRSNSK